MIFCFCPQGFFGDRENYLLFASLFEITMMDPSVGTRPVTFELSIGEQSAPCAACDSCYCICTGVHAKKSVCWQGIVGRPLKLGDPRRDRTRKR